jgi:hypothetical protein
MEPPLLTAEGLAPVVRRILEDPAAQPTTWTCDRLDVPAYNPGTAGIHRVAGTATVGRAREKQWSTILKVVTLPDLSGTPLDIDGYIREPSDWNYWKREVLARRCGLLDRFEHPLRPVGCWATEEVDDTTAWLWLEELDEGTDRPARSVSELAEMAYDLGAFAAQGTSMVDELLALSWTARDWLSGWASTFLELSGGHALAHPGCWTHPLLRDRVPVSSRQALVEVVNSFQQVCSRLATLPATVAHHDAKASNLFRERTATGERTVVIDWGFFGTAPIGADLGHHVALDVCVDSVDPADGVEHERSATDAYLAGLRDFGWRGDEADVRFAAAASGSLQMLCFVVDDVALLCPDYPVSEDWPAERAEAAGCDIETTMDTWAASLHFLLHMGQRARRSLG